MRYAPALQTAAHLSPNNGNCVLVARRILTLEIAHGLSKSSALSKVAYISPEQARGKQLDPRSDLFCLGAVLYEMATGTMPFRGDTPALVFDALLNRPPVTPTRLNPLLPVKVQAILLKLLEKNRDARYQSAKQLTADLTRVQKEMQREAFTASALASPVHPPLRPAKTGRIGKYLSAIALLAAVVAGGAFLYMHQNRPSFEACTLGSCSDRMNWPFQRSAEHRFGLFVSKRSLF